MKARLWTKERENEGKIKSCGQETDGNLCYKTLCILFLNKLNL